MALATATSSRFAVLSLDVDDDYSKRKRIPRLAVNKLDRPATNKQEAEGKKKKNKSTINQNNGGKNKLKSNQTNQSAAPQKKKSPSESSPPPIGQKNDFDAWTKKDTEIVDGNYQEDLAQAILLSKLDYEEKRDNYETYKQEATKNVQEKETSSTSQKKGKKSKKLIKVMSVEEFYNLGKVKLKEEPIIDNSTVKDEPNFFTEVEEDAKREAEKEQQQQRIVTIHKRLPLVSEETLTIAQLQDALEKKSSETESLRDENEKLKAELLDVKMRNKKLCFLLATGEMKNKAEVLVEVETLQNVKDELSAEIVNLHAQLEQERSKVRALTTERSGNRGKKQRHGSENNV